MKKVNRVNSLFTVAIALIIFLLSLTPGAQAVPIPVGYFTYDSFLAADPGYGLYGTATFTINNFTGDIYGGYYPDFPVATPIDLVNSTIVLEYSNGAGNVTQSLPPVDIAPGASQGAFWSYEFADYTAFVRATFSASINQGSIQVVDINNLGETVYNLYNVTSGSIFTELLPFELGTSLTPGLDLAVMYLDAEPATPEPVPEPSGLVLMGAAILMFIGWMRIRGEKRMTG